MSLCRLRSWFDFGFTGTGVWVRELAYRVQLPVASRQLAEKVRSRQRKQGVTCKFHVGSVGADAEFYNGSKMRRKWHNGSLDIVEYGLVWL